MDVKNIKVIGADDDDPIVQELKKQLFGNKTAADAPNMPMPDQLAILKDASKRYTDGNIFSVGQLVTPRHHVNLRGAGRPCVVLENVKPFYTEGHEQETSSHNYRRRFDMRVLHLLDSGRDDGYSLVSFWAESWQYEPWVEGMPIGDE